MANRVIWFDVPVEDLSRAIESYSNVLDIAVEEAHGVAVLEHSGNVEQSHRLVGVPVPFHYFLRHGGLTT